MPTSRADVNLWKIPLLLSMAALALFGLTMIPDVLDALGVIHLPTWFTMGGIDDARAILSAMLGSVSTVLALIFSVALLVLSMVATLFGPRLLYRFLEDWVTQFTIGLFMATFVYLCLVFLVTHQDAKSTFIPQVSLITSWFLVIISFGFLVYYSHRIAVAVQNPDLVARISDDLRAELVKCRVEEGNERAGTPPAPALIQQQRADGANVMSRAADICRASTTANWWWPPIRPTPSSMSCFVPDNSFFGVSLSFVFVAPIVSSSSRTPSSDLSGSAGIGP